MPHTSNDPVVTQTDAFSIIGEACRPAAVQNESAEYGERSAGNTSTEREVLDKPFVTVRKAAEILGVRIETVVYDVQEGMDGKLGTLTGGIEGGYWLVHSSDLQGESLERHRARLTPRENDAHG